MTALPPIHASRTAPSLAAGGLAALCLTLAALSAPAALPAQDARLRDRP